MFNVQYVGMYIRIHSVCCYDLQISETQQDKKDKIIFCNLNNYHKILVITEVYVMAHNYLTIFNI